MNNRVSPRAQAYELFSDYTNHDCSTMPVPVECLGWAIELLLDVLLCAASAPSPECAGFISRVHTSPTLFMSSQCFIILRSATRLRGVSLSSS